MFDITIVTDWLASHGIEGMKASLVLVLGGFVFLYFGGDWVVHAAVALARKMGVSRLLIGIVVVAFGTSSPELFVSLFAVFQDAPSIAVGNVVGSNIANILLVLALAALIRPIDLSDSAQSSKYSVAANWRNIVYRDGTMMLIATGLLIFLGRYCGTDQLREWCPDPLVIPMRTGVVLLGLLIAYILISYLMEVRDKGSDGDGTVARSRFEFLHWRRGVWINLILLLIGFALLFLGAEGLVTGAVDLAERAEVPRPIIAVSLVAFGTSVPELAAVALAAVKRFPQVAFGGIVGSNIFNILVVLGITTLFRPVAIAEQFVDFDFWVMLGAALLLMVFLWVGGRVGRRQALFMLLLYVVYIGYLYVKYTPTLPA